MLIPFWLFVLRPEQKAQTSDAEAAARRSRKPAAVRTELIKAAERLSAVPIRRRARCRGAATCWAPIERLLTQADSPMTVGAFLLICGICGFVTFAVVDAACPARR